MNNGSASSVTKEQANSGQEATTWLFAIDLGSSRPCSMASASQVRRWGTEEEEEEN